MEKDGESYLDELLNAVAPDWEKTSMSPEDMMEDFDDSEAGEISLKDALAVLDDLPDSEEDYMGISSGDDFGDFLGLDVGLSPEGDAAFAGEQMSDPLQEMGEMTEMPDIPIMDLTAPEEEQNAEGPLEELTAEAAPEESLMEELSEAEELSAEEPVEMEVPEEDVPVGDPAVEEMTEEVPDIPLELDAILPDEEPMTSEESQSSGDSVDVDDIFQDALSAVGYSGSGEEEEDPFAIGQINESAEREEDIASIPAVDPMGEHAMSGSVSEKKKKEKKGPGFFARVFGNIITDQTAAEEEKARKAEEEARAKKAKKKEEKKQQAEVSKEERAQLAAEEKERKKQLKAEEAARKAEEKEEKKRLKAEQRAEEEANEVVGKINPVGAAIVVIFFTTIGILTVFGSLVLNRKSALNSAENLFANGEYLQAYDAINSANMVEEDDILYRRIRICSEIQKEVNSYANYTTMGMRREALDSLVKGVEHYEENREDADGLGITGQINTLKSQIDMGLSDFGLGEDEARELLAIADRREYTRRLEEIIQ